MLSFVQSVSLFFLASQSVLAYNFPYESVQLKDADVRKNPDIAFGKRPLKYQAKCKTFPGDANWPSVERWAAFNTSLDGALVRGIPPAASCYEGPYYDATKCAETQAGQFQSLWAQEDPIIPYMQWQLGNPCPVPPLGTTPPAAACNITSYPAYAVNATTVKQIQAAVNFARNYNIRLVIKNTGHDFVGRATGGGALLVWTHKLKAFESLTSFKVGKYKGKAARVGAALQQYDQHNYMREYDITMLAPGSTTVGSFGGYMQGGGFSTIVTGKLGLMADQVLGLEIVTADGKFVHADPYKNTDLFWAIRGGGPSNFGIVTSAVIKTYDVLPISVVDLTFQTNPITSNTSTGVQVPDEVFWKGIQIYFSKLVQWTDAKGVGWNYIYTVAPTATTKRTFEFIGQVNLPGFTAAKAKEFVAPLYAELQAAGINLTQPDPKYFASYPEQAFRPQGIGEVVGNGRFTSRLLPRDNFLNPKGSKFQKIMAAIRSWVEEGGYTFHSVDFTPTEKLAGWPGKDSAVNPHLRKSIAHFTGFDFASYGPDASPAQQIESHKRLDSYAQKFRDATPGSGAYMNEADVEEPNWKESFYGDNYHRLYQIKKARDPWGVFYAVTMVASDEWYVQGTQGLPSQQGRLCRK
ncbi:FAD/FMN-containing isoamyl alcohol oxidase-like protein MreA [Lojkania enalia]|uniref:FAD/FMN-containing isoamyl alcohol oxidase-like protein MreA n=1 Tax=Lojkania enalia TaxID=147567 RepID=A0A9P4KG52_9PLEO|nr:FAD/FMN-containing isoamyl alcohol oxidase-like protein MreA [Didymosphaeria enalia]